MERQKSISTRNEQQHTDELTSEYGAQRYDWSRAPSFRLSRLIQDIPRSQTGSRRQTGQKPPRVSHDPALQQAPIDSTVHISVIPSSTSSPAKPTPPTAANADEDKYSTTPAADLLVNLKADQDSGLAAAEVELRQIADGYNELDHEEKSSILVEFLQQFTDVVVLLLLISSIVALAIQEYVEGVAILIIVTFNACIAVYTERQSGNAIAALSMLSAPTARVLRDGVWSDGVLSRDIVVGDIVEVSAGNVVPADIRLLVCHQLKVSETPLTGESADVKKTVRDIQANSAEDNSSNKSLTPNNCIFTSCNVTEGSAIGVVVAIGMNTKVGRIAALLASTDDDEDDEVETGARENSNSSKVAPLETVIDVVGTSPSEQQIPVSPSTSSPSPPNRSLRQRIVKALGLTKKKTPLQRSISKLGTYMGMFGVISAILVLIIGIAREHRDPDYRDSPVWLQMLLVSVSLAVGAIPEGLPIVTTICLALGSSRLAKQQALIRELPAVEALSAATVICSDKTGTITQSVMTAVKLATADASIDLQSSSKTDQLTSVAARQTLCVAALCNNSKLDNDGKPTGNATDAALLAAALPHTVGVQDMCERVDHITFTSVRKMMVTVHKLTSTSIIANKGQLPIHVSDGQYLICLKGAPQYVIPLCRQLNDQQQKQMLHRVDEYSDEALRVIGMAYAVVDELPYPLVAASGDHDSDNNTTADDADADNAVSDDDKLQRIQQLKLQFAGMIGLIDPERPGVAAAIEQARTAGIRTIMITGDYINTAVAIGRRVGLLPSTGDVSQNAVDCSALRTSGGYNPNTDIDDLTSRVNVFARARPEDKLVIVKSLQRQGHICGMTGDGVNDAPALKQADVGIAMGITGTEVSKGASKMILVDDNFVTIIRAVQDGRIIYSNIQKFVTFLLGTNTVTVVLLLLSVCAGLPLPLVALQILFINLVIEGLPALALSSEHGESGVMNRPPRRAAEFLVTGDRIVMIVMHGVALAIGLLVVFLLGLYWQIGRVLVEDIPYDDVTGNSVCDQFASNGSWSTIINTECATIGLEVARTMVFFTLVLSENIRAYTVRWTYHGFWVKPFHNPWLTGATIVSMAALQLVIWVPGLDSIFHVNARHMRWFEWLLCVACGLITTVIDEMVKAYLRFENTVNEQIGETAQNETTVSNKQLTKSNNTLSLASAAECV